jgi:hypothetical protein
MVHREGCRYLRQSKRAVPWRWAEGKPLREVFHHGWNTPCMACFDYPVLYRTGVLG